MKKEKRLLCLITTTICIIKRELLAICAMVMVESRHQSFVYTQNEQ